MEFSPLTYRSDHVPADGLSTTTTEDTAMPTRYSPPGMPTLTVDATREPLNGTARFTVLSGEYPRESVLGINQTWPQAWTLLLQNGAGTATESILRAALDRIDR